MHSAQPIRRPAKVNLVPRIKVWLEQNDAYAFGLGIAEILQAVERTGSIKHAASALGKSYRYVWARVKEAERSLGQQLVQTQVGGKSGPRSSLTELARKYTTAFLALRERLHELVRNEFERL